MCKRHLKCQWPRHGDRRIPLECELSVVRMKVEPRRQGIRGSVAEGLIVHIHPREGHRHRDAHRLTLCPQGLTRHRLHNTSDRLPNDARYFERRLGMLCVPVVARRRLEKELFGDLPAPPHKVNLSAEDIDRTECGLRALCPLKPMLGHLPWLLHPLVVHAVATLEAEAWGVSHAEARWVLLCLHRPASTNLAQRLWLRRHEVMTPGSLEHIPLQGHAVPPHTGHLHRLLLLLHPCSFGHKLLLLLLLLLLGDGILLSPGFDPGPLCGDPEGIQMRRQAFIRLPSRPYLATDTILDLGIVDV
mmetsp:Transcript_42535/g.90621  ORF Transcript_42535/g.90621 Transcript_42535/m.90621 type:complete len:302 (-) Transcript_42535:744-1649(-)